MCHNEPQQPSEPPNFYYILVIQRQTHASLRALQTNRGTIPLQNAQSSQDVKVAKAQSTQVLSL